MTARIYALNPNQKWILCQTAEAEESDGGRTTKEVQLEAAVGYVEAAPHDQRHEGT